MGAGEEGGEGGGEGGVAAHVQAGRGGDELLFGDVHLEEPVGEGVAERVGVGGVADLGVEDNQSRVG